MALLFGVGYARIVIEESLAFNKSRVGLLMTISLWEIETLGHLAFAEVSEIVFFSCLR